MDRLPVLYSFRRCPYAMRARMAIAVSGVKVELREVLLRDKPTELMQASAKATVPVLVLQNEVVIDESLDIMRWALAKNDPEDWLAPEEPDVIQQNDGPFKIALDRYKYPRRYGMDVDIHSRDSGLTILTRLDAALHGVPLLTGAKRTLADVAIFPFIRQFAAADQVWFDAQPLPALQRWLKQLSSSDLFASIMHRHPRWRFGDAPIVFP